MTEPILTEELRFDRRIDAGVPDVWRHLTNLEGLPLWLGQVEDVEVCWDPPWASRRYRIGSQQLEDHLLELVPGERIEMSIGGASGLLQRARVRVDLAPTDDGGTQLALTVHPEGRGGWLGRLLGPLLRLQTEIVLRQLVLAFRSFVEEARSKRDRPTPAS